MSQTIARATRSPLPLLGAGLSVLWLMHQAGYFALWSESGGHGHGALVLLVLAYIVYVRRASLKIAWPRHRWMGQPVALLAIAGTVAGTVTGISLLAMYGVWVFGVAGTLTVGGLDLARRLAAPLLIAFMVLPLPAGIEPIITAELQTVSSELGVRIIRLLGGVVHLDGNIIDLGTTKLLVAEACAGLRYLFPLMSLSALGGYLLNGPLWARLLLFLSAVPITIFMNGLRIGITGVLAERGGSAHVEGFLHWFEGWVIFAVAFLFMLLFAWLIVRLLPGPRTLFEAFPLVAGEPAPTAESAPSASCRPVQRSPGAATTVLAVFLVACAIGVTPLSARAEMPPERRSLSTFPSQLGEWQGRQGRLSLLVERVADASDYFYGDFISSDELVNVYVSYYRSQLQGSIPHSPEVCIPGDGWVIAKNEPVRIRNAAGGTFEVNRLVTVKGDRTLLAYYWLKQGERSYRGALRARLDLVRSSLFENRTDGALIRLVSELGPSENVAAVDARMGRLAQALSAVLPLYVPD